MRSEKTIQLHEQFKESLKSDLIADVHERVAEFQKWLVPTVTEVVIELKTDEDGQYCEVSLQNEIEGHIDLEYGDYYTPDKPENIHLEHTVRDWQNSIEYTMQDLEVRYLSVSIED